MIFQTILHQKIVKYSLKSYSFISKSGKMDSAAMLQNIKRCIPPLDNSKYKGQAGRIGVVGGSLEYTGAPYFSAISSLRAGADLSHIFCPSGAATVIKSFSPELIVHPLLDYPNAIIEISQWFERLHAIVIGPGLGRERATFNVVEELIEVIREKRIPLVIDADGLFLITEKPDLIRDFISPVILTPNKIELERLKAKMNGQNGLIDLGNYVTILKKDRADEVISINHEVQWSSDVGGSARRCGGQGDLLSGVVATFLHWMLTNQDKIDIDTSSDKSLVAASLACYAGTTLIRRCNEKAFKVKGRSMVASDMIDYIHESFEELFGQ